MKTCWRSLAALTMFSALLPAAQAVPLAADGNWAAFDVDELLAADGGLGFIDLDGTALSFQFTVAAGDVGTLTVVDAGFAGDRFELFAGGTSLGTTSAPGTSYPDSIGLDYDAALADGRYSQRSYVFGAGSHSVTGLLVQSVGVDGFALNATAGALRLTVSPVPEPGTAAGLLGGLALLAAWRRRAAVAATGTLCAATALAAGPAPINVKIIGFNDYHGNLQSPGSFGPNTITGTSRPAGGAEYLGAYVGLARAANPNLAVVGAGDFIGATPLISALFFDEPSVETLNRIGVDFIGVGNHEFDKGKDELRRLQSGGCKFTNGAPDPNSCKGFGSAAPGSFDGAKYKWLSANVIENATGRTLLPPYGIKSFGGVRVAFIGMTFKGTPTVVTPTGVAGLTFKDEAATVNALVPRLRALGIETIVVTLHQGGFQNLPPAGALPPDLPAVPPGSSLVNASDINGCMNNLRNGTTKSDIELVVEQLDDEIDLVISGHTHAAYNCSRNTVDVYASRLTAAPNTVSLLAQYPRQAGLPNKAGRLIPVTSASAFGRVVTEIDLKLDPATREPIEISPVNKVVDRTDAAATNWVAANPALSQVVSAYNTAVSPLANAVIGTTTVALPNVADANGTMPAGDLIADAQLAATQPASLGNAVMAFMNPGGVRNPGFPAGNVTYGQAFTAQPFGNSLVTMTLTAQQIKNLLEQQFVGCLGQGTQRILQISNGLQYQWDAAAAPCSKVRQVVFTPTTVPVAGAPAVTGSPVTIVDGAGAVQAVGPFRVTVNNFLATGGDGFSTLLGGTSVLGGAQDIDALVAYLAQFNATAGGTPYDPAAAGLGKPRITRLN